MSSKMWPAVCQLERIRPMEIKKNKLAVNKLVFRTLCRVPLRRLNSTGRYGCTRCWTNIFFPKFLHVPLGVGGWPLGYDERRCWANCAISFQDFQPMWSWSTNVTDGQTDGRTDDMRSQDRVLHYSASHGKNTTFIYNFVKKINGFECSLHC